MAAEMRLPKHLIDLSLKNTHEYGWRQLDILDVIEIARQIPMAIIGGQVQYIVPEGTCELYWLSYDAEERKENEDWLSYCDRTAGESSKKIKSLFDTDIQSEAINAFPNILTNNGNPIDKLDDYQIFILYFDDLETDLFINKMNK